MPLSKNYKQQLADIIASELERLQSIGVSERDFAGKLGVTYNATQKWRKQRISRGLSYDSIAGIARYLAQTPEAKHHDLDTPEKLQAYLAGTNSTATATDSLYDELRGQIAQLKVKVSRLETNSNGGHMPSVISYLINDAIKFAGANRNRFADLADLNLARLNELVDDGSEPVQTEYDAIAKALNHFRGSDWNAAELKTLYDNQAGRTAKKERRANMAKAS